MNFNRTFLTIGGALALLYCGPTLASSGANPNLVKVNGAELPSPTIEDMQASSRPYRVGPFDKLIVDVFGSEDLSAKELQIDASGRITFPLIGTLAVAGLTPGEVSQLMENSLRGRFIKNPQVSVNLKEIFSQTVTIGGEVKKPGVYPIVGKMTLMTAIASAEGWTDISSRVDVVVFRSVNGRNFAAVYDVKAIQKGRYADPEIFASDVIVVGDSQSRKIWKDFLGAAPLLAPLIYILGQ